MSKESAQRLDQVLKRLGDAKRRSAELPPWKLAPVQALFLMVYLGTVLFSVFVLRQAISNLTLENWLYFLLAIGCQLVIVAALFSGFCAERSFILLWSIEELKEDTLILKGTKSIPSLQEVEKDIVLLEKRFGIQL